MHLIYNYSNFVLTLFHILCDIEQLFLPCPPASFQTRRSAVAKFGKSHITAFDLLFPLDSSLMAWDIPFGLGVGGGKYFLPFFLFDIAQESILAIKNISFALRPKIYFLKYSTNQVLSFGAKYIKILQSDKMLLQFE